MSTQRSLAYRWLPDDTEESILGADWHQDAISSLRNGLRDVARARGWPWHVGDQLTLVAWHPDGTIWRPKPDIMVHPHAGPTPREEMRATADGLPALIIEVASPSTYLSDVNISPPTTARQEAKGYEYLAWPLPEYLVFDPTAAYLPGQVRSWRVVEGRVQEWTPDTAGRYHSRLLGVSFHPEGFFLRIIDPAGNPVPLDHEKAGTIVRLEQERAEAIRRAEQVEQERAEAIRRAEQVEQERAEAIRRAEQVEQERIEAIRRAEQVEQENAALRALLERLRGHDSG